MWKWYMKLVMLKSWEVKCTSEFGKRLHKRCTGITKNKVTIINLYVKCVKIKAIILDKLMRNKEMTIVELVNTLKTISDNCKMFEEENKQW